MQLDARDWHAGGTLTASVDECVRVRSGIMRAGMAAPHGGADPIELQAWLTLLEIACRLADEAQARG